MKKIVYCSQFRDSSGYAVAARGYLGALDAYLRANPGEFQLKVYTTILEPSNKIPPAELALIKEYEFKSDTSLEEFTDDEFLLLWHLPPPLVLFADNRFKASPGVTPSLSRLIEKADQNVNLVAWETSGIPSEWQRVYEYTRPDKIIVPCEWNGETFQNNSAGAKCDVVPHVIEPKSIDTEALKLPISLEDKFVVFTLSQWTHRKGFDKLIQAFSAEFGKQDDAVLVIKTHGSLTHSNEKIQAEVKYFRNTILLEYNQQPNQNGILLIPGFLSDEQIAWLYDQADLFSLLTRGEGFGLTIAEAMAQGVPVLVPAEGGHMDFIDKESAFLAEGMWDTCTFPVPPYESNGDWFITSVKSARKELRRAYDLWKSDPKQLKEMGEKSKLSVLSGAYSPETVGAQMYNSLMGAALATKENSNDNSISKRVKVLKQKIKKAKTLEERVGLLHNAFEGEECYILATGPSLGDYDPEVLKEKMSGKLVLTVKQAYDLYADVADFHFYNCANLPAPKNNLLPIHYDYNNKKDVISIASSNYEPGTRWSPIQKNDLFFKIPIRTEINNEFLCKTKRFNDYLLENTLQRPCGPGIMFETVMYIAAHLGVSKITAIGYDLSISTGNTEDHGHFFGSTANTINRGDILGWEMEANIDASKDAFEWLESQGIELELASNKSILYKGIPRVEI